MQNRTPIYKINIIVLDNAYARYMVHLLINSNIIVLDSIYVC